MIDVDALKVNPKALAKNIQRHFGFDSQTVLIFQQGFYDHEGDKCFNGGAERYMTDLADILGGQGYRSICCQISGKKVWHRKRGNLEIIGIPHTNSTPFTQVINAFTDYRFAIYSGGTYWGENLLHPNILISHGVTWDAPDENADSAGILRIFTAADVIVSVDTNTISWLRSTFANIFSKFPENINYIPNYVDINTYCPLEKNTSERLKIIFPRRACRERGYWLVSSILPTIMEKYSHIDFDFVGFAHGTSITNDIERLVKNYPGRISHYVVEPGKMVTVYQNADIVLIPTLYSEGTSLSCLEAQACGNVVIATNIGGIPNLVIDGYNGILINPSKKEFLLALHEVIKSAKLRKFLSTNAVATSQVYDIARWKERWISVLTRFCSEEIVTKCFAVSEMLDTFCTGNARPRWRVKNYCLFGLSVFKTKKSQRKRLYHLFGLRVVKVDETHKNKKYYIFGVKIFNIKTQDRF